MYLIICHELHDTTKIGTDFSDADFARGTRREGSQVLGLTATCSNSKTNPMILEQMGIWHGTGSLLALQALQEAPVNRDLHLLVLQKLLLGQGFCRVWRYRERSNFALNKRSLQRPAFTEKLQALQTNLTIPLSLGLLSSLGAHKYTKPQ